MAHLGTWVFLQVILVVLLSLPERTHRGDLGHDLSRPEAGGFDVRDGADGGEALFFTGVENGRADIPPGTGLAGAACRLAGRLGRHLPRARR